MANQQRQRKVSLSALGNLGTDGVTFGSLNLGIPRLPNMTLGVGAVQSLNIPYMGRPTGTHMIPGFTFRVGGAPDQTPQALTNTIRALHQHILSAWQQAMAKRMAQLPEAHWMPSQPTPDLSTYTLNPLTLAHLHAMLRQGKTQ